MLLSSFARGEKVPVSRGLTAEVYPDADETLWEAAIEALTEEGALPLRENRIGRSLFSVWGKGNEQVRLSYLPEKSLLTLLREPLPARRPWEKAGADANAPVVLGAYATKTSYSTILHTASGMGYALRLADGRLLVIDGGYDARGEMGSDHDGFVAFLKRIAGTDTPRVALWIITHPHNDHYGVYEELTPADGIFVEATLSSLPAFPQGDAEEMLKLIPGFGKNNVPAHSGDRYDFGEVSLEILATPEDLVLLCPPPAPKDSNTLSLIFRMIYRGQRILFTGDAYPAMMRCAAAVADGDLCADICQIAHHGRGLPGEEEFYLAAAPRVALWPACRCQIDYDRQTRGVNEWALGNGSPVEEHIVAEDGDRILPLPYFPVRRPYRP